MSLRPVVVDDTVPQIRYTGSGWTSDLSGSQDTFGTYGTTYNHSLHATNANDSLAFSFEGSSIRMFGTINLAPTYNYSVTAPDFRPPWECFVDNNSIGASKASLYQENNWLLCNADQLTPGAHELTLKINMRNGTTFWVDYMQYTPSKAPSDTAVFLVENTDPSISYDSSWRVVDGVADMTNTHGAQMTLNFTGTQLTWMGYIPIELPGNASSASYSIDSGSPTSFSLAGHAPFDGTSIFNQAFFTTPKLSNGPHTIAVTYNGDTSTTPLTLDYIYLTVPPGSNSGVVSGTPQPGTSSHRTPIGAIVGGTIGGIVAIAIALSFIFLLRRRRSKGVSHRPFFGGPSRNAIPVPFSPNQEPPSASSASAPLYGGDELSYSSAGTGAFVSGAMAQIGDTKQALVSLPDRTRVLVRPASPGAGPSQNVAATTEGPPRYSLV